MSEPMFSKTAIAILDCMSEIFATFCSARQVLIVPKIVTKDTEKFDAILEEYKIYTLENAKNKKAPTGLDFLDDG